MTRAGKSMFYFAFWIVACGASLFLFPKFCLDMIGIELPTYSVVRLFGMVLLFLAVYYFLAGRHPEFWPLYRITVYTRVSAFLIVAVMVLLKLAEPLVVGFVVVDLLGAVWTGFALRKDKADGLCKAGQL